MTTATLPTFAEYTNGDEDTRLRFERAYPESNYEHARIYSAWDHETARHESAIARQLFRHGEWAHTGDLERESCGACALGGFVSESSREDGYDPDVDGPNYAGWGRVYVQARRAIPERWRAAFAFHGWDNERYSDALGRDLVTFGHPGFEVSV